MLWVGLRILIFALGIYLTYRTVASIVSPGRPELDDPLARARQIGTRIAGHLQSAESGPLYEQALLQIGTLVEDHLPGLADAHQRSRRHIEERNPAHIQKEIESVRREMAHTEDSELLPILQKNLKLLQARMSSVEDLARLHERTRAQIQNILLSLENLEDRVITARLNPGKAAITAEIESLLTEVKGLEEAYKTLMIPE